MILDSFYLKIRGKPMVQKVWDLLKSDFEKRSWMFLWTWGIGFRIKGCDDNANIFTHFDTMHTVHEDLAALGDDLELSDEDSSTLPLLPLWVSWVQNLAQMFLCFQ